MNVFYLSKNTKHCAMLHCDKHVVKMCIEYAQLLSTAHRVIDGAQYLDRTKAGRKIVRYRLDEHDDVVYKACHVNHPSAVWTRESYANYMWLHDMWRHLAQEYTHRYGKEHECWRKLGHILSEAPSNIQDRPFTEPPPAMKQYPQCIVEGDSIASYRNYYCEAKAYFARWTNREIPPWFNVAA